MGLQRTPPHKANQPSVAHPLPGTNSFTPATGNTTVPSPSQVFQPRNTKVMRTPPPGSLAESMSQQAVGATAVGNELGNMADQDMEEMDVEEGLIPHAEEATTSTPQRPIDSAFSQNHHDSTDESTTPISTPMDTTGTSMLHNDVTFDATSEAGPSNPSHAYPSNPSSSKTSDLPPSDLPTTPAPPQAKRTRKSLRQSTVDVLAQPPIPVPVPSTAAFGKRYDITMDTLDLAIKAGTQRWTLKDFMGCFPLLSSESPEMMKAVYEQTCAFMRERIQLLAVKQMDAFGVGPALQLIDEVVSEAREHEKDEPGRDTWRPDLTPRALTAAANLPIYDQTYARLRGEYLMLHSDCATRYASLQAKQAELKHLESGVADGVVDLEKTIKLLDGFPTEEMMNWMEDVAPVLESRQVTG